MATTLPNTGAVIPATGEKPDQAVNNAAFTAIDTAIGGIIESGSNSNGDFIKFANGTMICVCVKSLNGTAITVAEGNIFRSAAIVFTYPVAFIAPPKLAAIAPYGTTRIFAISGSTNSTTVCDGYLASPVSQTPTILSASLVAIGRWK